MRAYPVNNCAEVLEEIFGELASMVDTETFNEPIWGVTEAAQSGWLVPEGQEAVLRWGDKEYLVLLREVKE
jgi:hypothetical protein